MTTPEDAVRAKAVAEAAEAIRRDRARMDEVDRKLSDVFIELGRFSAEMLSINAQLKKVGSFVPPDLTRANSITARIIRSAVAQALHQVQQDITATEGYISREAVEQMIELLEANGVQIVMKTD
jgi:capsule polysaccharide export protein KpsE/RkpR